MLKLDVSKVPTNPTIFLMIRSAYEVVCSDGSSDHGVWFRRILVRVGMCRLPGIKPSMDELDKVTELSNRLQRMSTWNFWAAGLMGVTALLSVWIRFLG
jgi:hypothetical protein